MNYYKVKVEPKQTLASGRKKKKNENITKEERRQNEFWG